MDDRGVWSDDGQRGGRMTGQGAALLLRPAS